MLVDWTLSSDTQEVSHKRSPRIGQCARGFPTRGYPMGAYPTGDYSIGDRSIGNHSPGDYHSRGYPTRGCATGQSRGFCSSMHARVQEFPSCRAHKPSSSVRNTARSTQNLPIFSQSSTQRPQVLQQENCKPVENPNHYDMLCTLKCRDHPTALDLETKSSAIKEGRR